MTPENLQPIPFFDLSRKIQKRRTAIDQAITRVMDRGQFILGPEVENFESFFANYIGVSHTIAVANGTDAIEIALRASGITDNDKVATAANAGNYGSTAILAIGATPTYMDVEYGSRNITLDSVEKAIQAGVKAIIATHLYGLAISEIAEIALYCRYAGVLLIEDCSQAHGARINGRLVGSFGDASAFSFYPTKNLGAIGDAGAITTNSVDIARAAQKLRTYGWSTKYSVELAGGRNSRADEIQTAVLSELLPYLDEDNQRRRDIAQGYASDINPRGLDFPQSVGADFVAHHFVISSPLRATYMERLQALGIATSIHFPISDAKQATDHAEAMHDLPVTDLLTEQVFSIPCYPELTDNEVRRVIEALNFITDSIAGE